MTRMKVVDSVEEEEGGREDERRNECSVEAMSYGTSQRD